MLKPNEFFSIQTSLESLNLKFKELENSHYGYLRKNYKDNEKTLREIPKLGSDQVQGILKEQNKLESDIKKVGSISEAYGEEMRHLKELILERKRLSPQEEAEETIATLQHLVKFNITSVREKVFSISDFSEIDQSIVYNISRYFDEAHEQIEQAFGHLDSYTESLRGLFSGNNILIRIEEVCSNNEGLLKSLDLSIDQFKNKIQNSSSQFDHLAAAFGKDSQFLKENITQIKTNLKQTLKEAKSESKARSTDEDFSFKARKILLLTDQLLDEAMSYDSKKNKVFTSVKEEFSGISGKSRTLIKEASTVKDSIEQNNKNITSFIKEEVIKSASRISRNEKSSSTLGSTSKKQRSIESPRTIPRPPPKSSDDYEYAERRGSRGSEIKSGNLANENEKLKIELEDTRREYDNFVNAVNQKLSYLKSSARNFLISSTKISRFANSKSVEQELTFKIFENDKKSLENYLNTLNDFATDIRQKGPKLAGIIRSQSSEPKKRGSTPGSPFIDEDERNEYFNSRTPPRSGNKIKDMIDDFEKSNSHIMKPFEKDISASRLKGLSHHDSPSERHKEDSSAKKELFGLKIKHDQLMIENKQIKDENMRLKSKSPSKMENSESVLQYKLKIEALEADKKKLAVLAKKFEAKSVERKNSIKQLFLVIEEKDKEIEYYKNRGTAVSSQSERIDELIRKEQSELEKHVSRLEQELKKKDEELSKALDTVSKYSKNSSPIRPSFGGFTMVDSADQSFDMKRDQKIEILQQDLKDLDVKKQKLVDVIPSVESISTAKASELNDMIVTIDKEREAILRKIHAYQNGSFGTEENDRKDSTKEKIIDLRLQIKSLQNERDIIKEASLQQEYQIEQMKAERRALEEQYNDMAENLNNAVDFRKKIEKNAQDTAQLYNAKIKELTEYISELELKNDIRAKESQHAEKLGASPFAEQRKEDELAYGEIAAQLEDELSSVNEYLDAICEALSFPLDTFGGANPSEKAARLIEMIKDRDEKNKKDESAKIAFEKFKKPTQVSPKNTKSANEAEIFKKQISDMELFAAQLKSEIRGKTKECEDMASIIRKKENEVKRVTLESENLKITINTLSAQVKDMEPRLTAAESDLESLLLAISTTSKKHNFKKVEGANSAIQVVETLDTSYRELKRLKEELQSKEEIYSSKEEDLRGAFELKEKTYAMRQNDLEATVQSLRQSNEAIKKELFEREQELSTTQDALNSSKIEEEARKKELERIKKDVQSFKDENAALQQRLDETSSALSEEKDIRQKEARAYKDKSESALRERKKLEIELEGVYNQKNSLEQRVHELEEKVQIEASQGQDKVQTEFKAKLAEKDQQISHIKKEMNKKIDDLNVKFWNDTEKYNSKIEDLASQLKHVEAEKRSLETLKKQLKDTIDAKDKEIFELCDQYSSAAKAKMEAEDAQKAKARELDLLKTQFDSLKSSTESSINDLQKVNKQLGQEKIRLEQELATFKQTADQSSSTIDDLTNKVNSLSREKLQLAEKFHGNEGKSIEYLSTIEQKDRELASLKETIRLLNKNKEDMEVEVKFAQTALSQNRNMVIEMESKISSSERDYQSKLKSLQDELSTVQKESASVKKELETTRAERDSLLQEASRGSSESQEQTRQLQVQIKNLMEQIKTSQETQLAILAEKEQLEMENDKLHAEKEELLSSRDREERELVEALAVAERNAFQREQQLKEIKVETKSLKDNYEKELLSLRQILNEKETNIENIFNELEKSKKIMQDQNAKITQLGARAQSLENQNAAISSEKEALLAQKALLSKESSSTLENVSSKIKEYEFSLQTANSKCEDFERNYKEAVQEREDLQILHDQLTQKYEKSQNDNYLLRETIRTLELQIEENEDIIKSKDREISEHVHELQRVTQNFEESIQGLNARLQKEKEDRLNSSNKKRALDEESSKLAVQIREQDEIIIGLNNDITSLKKDLDQVSESLAEAVNEKGNLAKQILESETTNENLRKMNDDLVESNSNLKAQVDAQEETINELYQTKVDQEAKISQYNQEIDALKDDYNASIEGLELLKHSIEAEQKKVVELESRNQQLEQELDEANEKVFNLELQNDTLQANCNELTETNGVLNRKIAQLTSDFEMLRNMEDQNESARNSESERKYEESQNENTKLKTDIEEQKEIIENLESQLADLTKNVVLLKSEKQDLVTQLKEDQQERLDITTKHNEFITELRSERDELAHDLEELKTKNETNQNIIKNLEVKLSNLSTENATLQEELEKIRATNQTAEFEEKIKLLNSALQKVNDQKEDLQNKYDALQNAENEWSEENESLRKTITEKDQMIFDLDSKASEMQIAILSLEKDVKEANEKASKYDEDEILELKEKNIFLANRIKDVEQSLYDFQAQNEELTEKNSELKNQYEDISKRFTKLESANTKKGEKDTLIKDQNKEIEQLNKDNFQQKSQIEKLNQSIAQLQIDAEEVGPLRAELKRLNQNIIKLEKENNILEQKIATFNQEKATMGAGSPSGFFIPDLPIKKTSERRDASPDKETLKSQLVELEDEKKRLENNINDLKDELELLKAQNEAIYDQIDKNKNNENKDEGGFSFRGSNRVSFAFEANQQLKDENDEIRKNYERLQNQFIQISEEKNKIKQILTQSFSEISSLGSLKSQPQLKHESPEELQESLVLIKTALKETEDTHNESALATEKEVETLRNRLLETERNTQKKIDLIKAEVEKEKQQLKLELASKLNRFVSEINNVMNILQIKPVTLDDFDGSNSIAREEKILLSSIRSLGEELKKIKSVKAKDLSVSDGGSKDRDVEVLQSKLKEFEQREKELLEINEQHVLSLEEKEAVIENMKKSITKDGIQLEKSISLIEEIDVDDKKVKSYLEDSGKVDRNESRESEAPGNEEFIRSLRDDIRTLEDQNQTLESEFRKAKSDYDVLRFKYENLKEELTDNESNVKRMEFQMSILKKELQDAESKHKNVMAHEKEGIKMMFVKFMEGSLEKQSKESMEYLKTLLTLLGFPEKEKQITLESFKSKSAKKGTFSKMFS